jgi:pyruvate dehydrogenase E1 component
MASTVPSCRAYDPAFAYELAVIIQDGIKKMFEDQATCFYYVTLMNENYAQPEMPAGVEEGIRKGIYLYQSHKGKKGQPKVQLFGSGTILLQALAAQELLAEHGVSADVWSVTSYTELRRDAISAERFNRLHPAGKQRRPYISQVLEAVEGPIVAASDYMAALPDMLTKWIPQPLVALGTDGFGRSDSRAALRRFFEVDSSSIAAAAFSALAREGTVEAKVAAAKIKELGVDSDCPDPWTV